MSNKGGLRPGAGRRPAEQRVSLIVRLKRDVAWQLRETIPNKSRSVWIERLIIAGLKKYQAKL